MALFPFSQTYTFLTDRNFDEEQLVKQQFESVRPAARLPDQGNGAVYFKGIGRGPRNTSPPRFEPADPGYATLQLQYSPKTLDEEMGNVWAEGNGQSRLHPILHWLRGREQMLTFSTMLQAPSELLPDGEALMEMVDDLKRATRLDPKLGRPPIWDFKWGDLSFGWVVFDDIGPIRYEDMQTQYVASAQESAGRQQEAALAPGRGGGPGDVIAVTSDHPRRVSFEIKLRKYEPFAFENSSPNERPHQSFHAVANMDDHWEHIAKRLYGRPFMGDLLRQRHPRDLVPVPGRIYLCPDKDQILDEQVEPYSTPMARTVAGMTMREDLFRRRAAPRYHVG